MNDIEEIINKLENAYGEYKVGMKDAIRAWLKARAMSLPTLKKLYAHILMNYSASDKNAFNQPPDLATLRKLLVEFREHADKDNEILGLPYEVSDEERKMSTAFLNDLSNLFSGKESQDKEHMTLDKFVSKWRNVSARP